MLHVSNMSLVSLVVRFCFLLFFFALLLFVLLCLCYISAWFIFIPPAGRETGHVRNLRGFSGVSGAAAVRHVGGDSLSAMGLGRAQGKEPFLLFYFFLGVGGAVLANVVVSRI